jgi:AcrR family transcriptional regulator
VAADIQQRARTPQQKALRRREILQAADAHFAAVGFEAFSMATIGRQARVAKGTLYLYFETREELLLELFLGKFRHWQAALIDAAAACESDRAFATVFYESACQDPAFLQLSSRLDSVIEHNVSLATLIAAKRTMAAVIRDMAQALAVRLELSTVQALDAITSLMALLLGVSQMDAGPQLANQNLPEDVRQLISAFSPQEQFTGNACRILSGIRAGT